MIEVFNKDSLEYLKTDNNKYKSIITSLPDMNEMNINYIEWINFINRVCILLIKVLDDYGVIYFYQTNRFYNNKIIDKKYIISGNFNQFNLIIDKIVLKQAPNTVSFFRPTFSYLFAFSKNIKPGIKTPDVINSGKMIYNNAMDYNAVNVCIDHIKKHTDSKLIFDPFCGKGSVLKIAKENGFDIKGIDIDINQVNYTKELLNTIL